MFKQFVLMFALMFCGALPSLAQEKAFRIADIMASLPEGCVNADYRLSVSTPGNADVINYRGSLWWQNGMFRIEGEGYTICCNGEHLWTVDSASSELVREAAVPVDELIPSNGYKTRGNPELAVRKSPDGKSIEQIVLKMENGTAVTICLPSMKVEKLKPSAFFAFDEKSLPATYVVTVLD